MLGIDHAYDAIVRNSEKANWKLDEAMPAGTRLDFTRPFLPDALANTRSIAFLDARERMVLNQIAGNSYLNLFAFVEEYILATVIQHATAALFGDREATRALLRFAEEESKHQMLFHRYREAFDADFGSPCGVLESAVEVAQVIMSKSPIAVMLVTLHLELMTQQHYTECVKDDEGVDPLFKRLLRFHWMEESQHAVLDAYELDKLLDEAPPEAIDRGFDDYLDICGAFEGLLDAQAGMDVDSFARATGRAFSETERAEIKASQRRGYVKTFLWYGMTNRDFIATLERISQAQRDRVAERAAALA
jgi:hypothetical protein